MVSGPQIYAVVGVNGVSMWDSTVQNFLSSHHQAEEDRMFDAVVNYVGRDEEVA